MFVIDDWDSASRSSINQWGHYQTDLRGLAVEVKDSARKQDRHQNIREERVAAVGTDGIANMMSSKGALQMTRAVASEPDELKVDADNGRAGHDGLWAQEQQ